MSIIVTESLSRGLRKRFIRETADVQQTRQYILKNFHPRSRRKGAVYRELTKCLMKYFDENAISIWEFNDGKKSDYSIINYWGIENGCLSVESIFIERKCPLEFYTGILCTVSNHACERIFERMNTTDTNAVKKELISCIDIVFKLEMALSETKSVTNSISIPTENGLYILDKDKDDLWKVITWINKDIFDKNQSQYYEKCMEGNFFEINLNLKGRNITNKKRIQLS